MIELYFGNTVSMLTSALVLAMLALIVYALSRRGRIEKWGRLILLFVLAGTAVSALAATRDAYATPSALFAMESAQSFVCSAAGGAIYLAALVSIFLKKHGIRKYCFYAISLLFIAQVAVIEASRIAAA